MQKHPMETGKIYTFKTLVSPYQDDIVSECSIQARFENIEELELVGNIKCMHEKSLLGQFVFSEQASFIPQQYWGRWGKTSQCNDVTAIIQKTWLTNDSDWGAAIVLSTRHEVDGRLEIYGIEEYEDILSESRFNLQLKHNKLYLIGSHHASDFDQILVKCSEQEF